MINNRMLFHKINALAMLICMVFLYSVITACSKDDYAYTSNEETEIVLTFQSDNLQSSTRAISSSNEGTIKDLTVFIFDSTGDVIGFFHEGPCTQDASGIVTAKVKTRKATGCTIYAVANADNVTGMVNPFKTVKSKSEFDALTHTISNATDIGNKESMLMFGKLESFPTTNSASISLKHLAAKIIVNITPATGVTVDSYQLFSVPNSAHYSDTNGSNASAFLNFSQVTGATSSTYYVYENLCGKGSNTKTEGWAGRTQTNAATNASYILINFHSATWKSTARVYIGGKTLPQADTSYDYTDYTIYRNHCYTVNITLNANGGHTENHGRVDYNAVISYSISVTAWPTAEERSIDMTK